MNNLDKQYTNLLQDILDNGTPKSDRTGTGTISVFGRQIRHKMSEGFPLLTTKKMPFKTIVTELLWFLRGDTNIKYLVDSNCHIWDGDCYKAYATSHIREVRQQQIKMQEEGWKTLTLDPYYLTQEEFINKIKTDDEFAKKWGELGPVYGKQWRKWKIGERKLKWSQLSEEQKLTVSNETLENTHFDVAFFAEEIYVDQIQNLINDLKTNPDSRRLMVNAWNVGELDQMVLPPCHYGFQVYTRELSLKERMDLCREKLNDTDDGEILLPSDIEYRMNKFWNIPQRAISLMWNQRSVDTGLGWSFNIASYSLLLIMLAKQVNMIPDEIICNLGDVHLYSNHIEPIKEQLGREPFPLPNVILSDRIVNDISEYTLDDIRLENYQSHPTIKLPLSN